MEQYLTIVWPASSPYPPKIECTCGDKIGPDEDLKRLVILSTQHWRTKHKYIKLRIKTLD